MTETNWQTECADAASAFALKSAVLSQTNPYDFVALDFIVNTLMTELWDNGFSQTEIRAAFEQAVADMPRYAAGLERRSDWSSDPG